MNLLKTIFAALVLSFASSKTIQADEPAPVYFVAQINVEDQGAFFNGYAPEAFKYLPLGKAQVLIATPAPLEILEGEWRHNWNVFIKFPSRADFDKFYLNEGYQALAKPKRLAATNVNDIVLFKGTDPMPVAGEAPAYFMAKLKVEDKEKFFGSYIPEVKKHVAAGGGKVLFGGSAPEVLEGSWDGYWTIFIQFPSMAGFERFYHSDGNLNVALPIRQASASENNLVVFQTAKNKKS